MLLGELQELKVKGRVSATCAELLCGILKLINVAVNE